MATSIFSLVGKIALDGMKRVNDDMKAAEAKTKDLRQALGMLGQQLTKTGAALSKNISAPLAGVGVAIGALAIKTGAYASELGSLSEATGLSTTSLQEYEQVARAAGVSSDTFLKTVSKLSSNLTDISNGTGPAAVAMDKLGISVTNTDGSLRSMDDLLPDIIGRLNGIEDVNERNGVAADIFGKKLKDVAPILAMTTTELDAVRKSAHDTGKVMGEDALKEADSFRLSIDNLKKDFSMLGMQIGSAFIPILQNQVMPLLQDNIIPLFKGVSEKIKDLATWFGNLNPIIQTTTIVFGAAVAAAGPMLLITGKMVLSIKALIPVVTSATGAFSTLWAVIIANPLILLGTAIAAVVVGLGALLIKTKQLNEETARQNAETEKMSARTDELNKQVKATGQLVDEYKKLKGTQDFDPAEMQRLTAAHEDAVVSLKNHSRAMSNSAAMTDEEEAATRRNIRAKKDLATEADKAGIAEAKLTDLQRAKLAQENEERKKAYADRKKELAALVKAHQDATDQIMMTEAELLNKEEQIELQKAKSLGASEAEMQTIRNRYIIQREDKLYKLSESYQEANKKIVASEYELLNMEEEKALKELTLLGATEKDKEAILENFRLRRSELDAEALKKATVDMEEAYKKQADLTAQWEEKLLQQRGNSTEILEAEKQAAIKAADEAGIATTQIEQYYANQKQKIKEDANAQWENRLRQQSGSQMSMLEAERAREIALAAETGADVLKIEEYYKKERIKLQQNVAESWVTGIVSTVNKIGNIISGFAQNEEKRLSKEYKDKRAYIEANVTDEEERTKQLEALQQQEDAKKLEIQKEQAGRDKAIGVFTTIVDTARAIVKSLAELGPIAGPIAASFIGGLGVAQTGVIASTPEPFAAGGLVQGGRGGVYSQIGEGKQDELVLPLETGTQRLAEDLGALLQERQTTTETAAPQIEYHTHLHVGTLVADEKGLKELERELGKIRITENLRTGRAA